MFMSEEMEAKGSMMPPKVAPTFLQRLCDLLHQRVTVSLTCPNASPVAGTLHAVGQDYIELHNGSGSNTQATIIPIYNICAVQVAGAKDQICPPPQPYPGQPQYPVSPGMGMGPGMMPGCPPTGPCPPGGWSSPPGMGMGPMPGMMEVKDVKEEAKEEKEA
ncbi:hypothetical protein [Desulforamulus hydrothermalis]|uniref:Uncharacterized protein n=1 Tax=Desulforamulus hydrothermalis Lam5 = DSM 18033 TaxID=1121428 RepID=K8EBR3_9FIRM|nr:hypothetical protein [Desulforamulus hydrothermalis]CCO09123.1 conserved hypothetical protein [Desulforamulus hydrothermalis Lam5 = DSM 18033]SHH12132.1 hypothetical protein SAMN02745177_01524 [Desulforamulus hydrothermalis Lam5 = DSM 18033]